MPQTALGARAGRGALRGRHGIGDKLLTEVADRLPLKRSRWGRPLGRRASRPR